MNKRPSQMALRARILALRWRRAHAAMRVLAADSIAAQTEFVGADAVARHMATASAPTNSVCAPALNAGP